MNNIFVTNVNGEIIGMVKSGETLMDAMRRISEEMGD